MRSRKVFLSVILFLLAISIFSSSISAWPWSKKEKTELSYISPDGWKIVGIRRITETGRFQRFLANLSECPKCVEILLQKGAYKLFDEAHWNPESWWSILMDISPGEFLMINKNSKIILVGIRKGDTLRIPSQEIVFCKGWGGTTPGTVFKNQSIILRNTKTTIYLEAVPFKPQMNDFEWVYFENERKYYLVGYVKFPVLPKMDLIGIEVEGFNSYPKTAELSERG